MSGPEPSAQCSPTVVGVGACERTIDACCLSTVPPKTFQPYTIGCFVGCAYGDSGCTYADTAGTTLSFKPQLSLYPQSVWLDSSTVSTTSVTTGNGSGNGSGSNGNGNGNGNNYVFS